jgi:hypothetical protein
MVVVITEEIKDREIGLQAGFISEKILEGGGC